MELSLGSRFKCSAPVHIFVAISLQVMASPKDEDREMERIQVWKFLSMNQFQLLHLPFSGKPSAATDQRPTGGNKIYEASAGSQRKRSNFLLFFHSVPSPVVTSVFAATIRLNDFSF